MKEHTLKCSDFNIIKLRYYADKRVIDKHYRTPGHEKLPLPKQHHERAAAHGEFYWRFIEKVTGKNMAWWYNTYMFDTRECANDEILETHGIIFMGGEGCATYLIPVRHEELTEWVKTNATVPLKVGKKISMFWINHWGSKVNTERRVDAAKRTIEFMTKHNLKPLF